MYTPTNSVENSLPSLSTTLAKGDLDVPVSPTHRHTAGLRRSALAEEIRGALSG